jgi:hypothetical protein
MAVLLIFLFVVDQAWAPDLPGPLVVQPNGGASGGPVLMLRNGDIQQPRNIQLGYCDQSGCDPNGDVGAGGDGAPGHGPRGRLSIQYDVGLDTMIWDGQKGPLLYLSKKRSVLFSDHKPMIKLEHGQIYLYVVPRIIGHLRSREVRHALGGP